MDSVQQWKVDTAPPQRKRSRLAAALGVERRTLEPVLVRAQYDVRQLRTLTLTELRGFVNLADAERIFYLVQWERLQAHLELYGALPEEDLGPLLQTLTPIFERHFSGARDRSRLNETLVALYRAEFSGRHENLCLNLTPPSQARRLLGWLGF